MNNLLRAAQHENVMAEIEDEMDDKALYDLLAKAQLTPNELTPIERLIWWVHDTRPGNDDILIEAAAQFEKMANDINFDKGTE